MSLSRRGFLMGASAAAVAAAMPVAAPATPYVEYLPLDLSAIPLSPNVLVMGKAQYDRLRQHPIVRAAMDDPCSGIRYIPNQMLPVADDGEDLFPDQD